MVTIKRVKQHTQRIRSEVISGPDVNTDRMAEMETAPPGGYTFPMVRYTDMDDEMKKEVS